MALVIYNTLTREKEPFEPVTPGKVGIYLCGPTVYKPSHIGHAVSPILFDTVKRYLCHKGYEVKFIVNITDVDDKLIAEAAKRGMEMSELATEVSNNYFECLDALGVKNIDEFPRATDNIGRITELVQKLIDNGAAYVVEGDVYFDHTKSPDYGKLSGRNTDEALSGTRSLASKGRHAADFVLWKACKAGEPAWNSPWGQGRPGWHIECSAMSMAQLGETFDIHGGGMDLIFPHHENEIAQSECATGKTFAKYWMHNGLTRIKTKAASGEWNNEKMSKSLGNIRTISSLLQSYSGETIRMFVLSTHYRRPLDFSDEQLDNTAKALSSFYRLFDRIQRITGEDMYASGKPIAAVRDMADNDKREAFVREALNNRIKFYQFMDDDFNTAGAIATMHELAATINKFIDSNRMDVEAKENDSALLSAAGRTLIDTGRLLGIFEAPPEITTSSGLDAKLIELLIKLRKQAREDKNYQLSDDIRDGLADLGIVLEDGAGETLWRKS